jgi:hypothetical protein
MLIGEGLAKVYRGDQFRVPASADRRAQRARDGTE